MRQYVHTEVPEETAAIIFQVQVKDYLVFLDFLGAGKSQTSWNLKICRRLWLFEPRKWRQQTPPKCRQLYVNRYFNFHNHNCKNLRYRTIL